jgi:hypothetical protein
MTIDGWIILALVGAALFTAFRPQAGAKAVSQDSPAEVDRAA